MARPSWIGQTLGGRYEIIEELGAGGMSAVYKANDPNLKRVVAIKLIHDHLSRDVSFVRRFQEEAAAVAQLRHPNIVQVYDFSNDGDTYYIVFEFVPGVTLQDQLKRLSASQRRMELADVTKYSAGTADALEYAHQRGLVHRDVKPANVMINVYGDAILTDFGIVKIVGGTQHTATGAVMGTARYMSPEQIRGQQIDGRSDVYSLGVVLYEMLSGRPPYDADSAMSVMMMHVNDPVPEPMRNDIPAGLAAVVKRAMAKNPHDRFRTAGEFAAAIRRGNLGSTPAAAPGFGNATVLDTNMPDPGATVLDDGASSGQATVLQTGGSAAPNPSFAQPGTFANQSDYSPRPPQAANPANFGQAAPLGGSQAAAPAKKKGGINPFLIVGAIVALLILGFGAAIGFGLIGGGDDGDDNEAIAALTATAEAEEVVDAPEIEDDEEEVDENDEPDPTSTLRPTATIAPTSTPTPTADVGIAQTAEAATRIAADIAAEQATAEAIAVAATQTAAAIPPTVTPAPPTAIPTTPPVVVPGNTVRITNIVIANDVYQVSYETTGYTEVLPGMHIHFYWNNISEDRAGVGPSQASWVVYGGPRPFTQLGPGNRPGDVSQMCAVVANPDHTIQPGTGNCFSLP